MSTRLPLIPTSSAFQSGDKLVTIQGGAEKLIPVDALPGSGYDVTAYGASADGLIECSAQIQDAIDTCAAAGGGTVLFPPGTYLTDTPVTVHANVRLLGYYATILLETVPDDGADNGALVIVNGSNVIIEGLILDGAKSGTSGSGFFEFGLIESVRDNATAWKNISVIGCTIRNSAGIGIRLLGNLDGIAIERNVFEHNFLDIFAEKASSYIFKNVAIRRNDFRPTWFTGTYSGAVKMKGDIDTSVFARFVDVSDNMIRNSAEMGIELFGGFRDSSVVNNHIEGSIFGISINNGNNVTVGLNKVYKCAYVGIEIAENSHHCIVVGNTVEQYTTGNTRGGDAGIITSGTSGCYDNIFAGNTVRGTNKGIDCQHTDRATLVGNRIEDCTVLIQIKRSNFVTAEGNHLYAGTGSPATEFHIFVDFTNENCTNIDVIRNYLYGRANNDNIITYRGATSWTLSNLRVAYNNVAAASYSNTSFNSSGIPNESRPNLQCYDNYSVGGGDLITTGVYRASWPDFTTNAAAIPPFAASIQAGGISTAGKTTVTVPAGAVRWVKVFSHDYGLALLLQCHFFAANTTNGDSSSVNAIVAAAPFDLNSSVTLLPCSFFSGIIDEVIYNNSGSAIQEVWLKLKSSDKNYTISCHFSDHASAVIGFPALTTTEPTWSTANHYRALIGELNQTHTHQASGIHATKHISSGTRAAIDGLRGRLHIKGAGVTGGTSGGRIATFETDAGVEAVGIDETGGMLAKLSLNVGNTGADGKIIRIASGNVTASFGTIGAGGAASYGCACPGARAANNPSVSVGFANALPAGIIFVQARVTADDVVTVELRNITGANIAVGDVTVRTTCTQF